MRLETLCEQLEQDSSLDQPARLRERVEALEALEAYCPDGENPRAAALCARLEAVNARLFEALRGEIQRGARGDILTRWAGGPAEGEGYDYLDELVLGVLQFDEPGAAIHLGGEMVFYQPTPARHIFDLFERTALTARDVLVDLGSGLGQVPLLAAICTDARAVGIELEPPYVACARSSARALHLTGATFLEQDARAADYSTGSVFYLYTPFTGSILRAVLDSLRREAARRSIRVCTFGPCTAVVAEEPWLRTSGAVAQDRIAVFRS